MIGRISLTFSLIACCCITLTVGVCRDRLGIVHKVGDTFFDDCISRKTCQGEGKIAAVSRCAAIQVKPECRMVRNPKRNDTTFTNCCDVVVCFKCNVGTFGKSPRCKGQCHCVNQNKCHILSGSCAQAGGCAPGYTGAPTCQKVCPVNYFGPKCKRKCRCVNNAKCHHVTGSCDAAGGCKPGWTGGGSCQAACQDGRYGDACENICRCLKPKEVCRKTDGHCKSGCSRGFVGKSCNTTCSAGRYGRQCLFKCNCRARTDICRNTDGFCRTGCAEGYNGNSCDITCTNKTFGFDCAKTCNCLQTNESCDVRSGVCRSGCAVGFKPPSCQSREKKITSVASEGVSPLVIGLVCGGVGLLLILVVVALAIFVYKRRRRNRFPKSNPPGINQLDSVTARYNSTLAQPEEVYENIVDLPTPTKKYNDSSFSTPKTGADNHYEARTETLDENGYLVLQPGYEILVKNQSSTTSDIPVSTLESQDSSLSNVSNPSQAAPHTPYKPPNIHNTKGGSYLDEPMPLPTGGFYENVHKYENVNAGIVFERSASEAYENV